jgi:murein DD-endopeptidase MepM/ murein hydrolase activator NlpD
MAQDGKRGIHQVQSVSQGVVEQLGWLELGGYRVGIRSPQGIYYYYAHLDSYATGLKKGDSVKAGTFLGYMGDTGYGKEGTRGQFPVHLHFGIYYNQGETEKSINPYSTLQYLEDAVQFSIAGRYEFFVK